MNTERVKISELKVGDIVLVHGGLFKLEELRYDAPDFPIDLQRGNIRNFRSEFIADADPCCECAVPTYWRKGWSIQSNDLATWTRVTSFA